MNFSHHRPHLDVLSGGFDDLPQLTTQTFIGIVVAVSGNVLISLALNLQKLAHKRVKERKQDLNQDERRPSVNGSTLHENDEENVECDTLGDDDAFTNPQTRVQDELQPLISHREPMAHNYGTETPSPIAAKQKFKFRFIPFRANRHTPTRVHQ